MDESLQSWKGWLGLQGDHTGRNRIKVFLFPTGSPSCHANSCREFILPLIYASRRLPHTPDNKKREYKLQNGHLVARRRTMHRPTQDTQKDTPAQKVAEACHGKSWTESRWHSVALTALYYRSAEQAKASEHRGSGRGPCTSESHQPHCPKPKQPVTAIIQKRTE